MKHLKTSLLALTCLASFSAHAQKYVGGDISLLSAYEEHGASYYDTDGTTPITNLLEYFQQQGHNAMRVRLFHTPSNAPAQAKGEGVIQDLPYVVALGQRIKANGMAFMLDLHYSDTWADPSNQWLPKAWEGLTDVALQDSVYNYTKKVLQALVDANATPDFIQTGNEISYGMLWGVNGGSSCKKYYAGQSTNAVRFFNLLKYAGKACRDVCPNAKIILHTERISTPDYIVKWYKDMDQNQVDYDIIGTSYYSYYHGDLKQLSKALQTIERNFSKDIMVVETGYYHDWQPNTVDYDLSDTYPINGEGQKAFTEALIDTLNAHPQVKGLFWWDMEVNEHGLDWNTQRVTDGWYNAGLFDNATGAAEPAIKVLKNFLVTDKIDIPSANATAETGQQWYTLSGQAVQQPQRAGIYIHNGRKTVRK